MLTLILCGTIFVGLFYYFCIKPMSYWKNRGIKQANPAWFFGDNLGITLMTQSFSEMVECVYSRFPECRYSGMYQFTKPTLVLQDPELLKQIAVKDFDHFTDHLSFIPEDADPLWSKNLFALTGQSWRDMRPILSPAFTSSKMKSMFVLMSDCVETFIKHFLNKNQDIIEIEMKDTVTRYGNDVIASAAFGIKVDSLADPTNEFYLMGKEATNFSGFSNIFKFFGFMFMPKLLTVLKIRLFSERVSKFFLGVVDETIKNREEKGIVRPDVIHLLMEARKGRVKNEDKGAVETGFAAVEEVDIGKGNELTKQQLTNTDITAQALIFFFGGFDSITTVMSFMAYELAVNQDIQTRLRREIEDTIRECDRNLTYDALMKMKYMDMVVSESLRKWPNGVAVDRVCTKPYTIQPATPEEKPLHLEKGTVLWLPIFGIHRDPKYYPEPEKFDPERFNDENKAKINPYTYLPFGLGPRNCIASRFALLEIKTLFFHLLLNFEIIPVKKTQIPMKLSKRGFVLTAEGGFWLGLQRIKN